MPRDFCCPLECLPGVGDVWSGEYDFPGVVSKGAPVILDIGANCGSYSARSLAFWPSAIVHAYEPNPKMFEYLRRNCEPRVICHNSAVGDPLLNHLYHGNSSALCGSQYCSTEQNQQSDVIDVISPEFLPEAEVVKLDAEGAEGFIIERLTFTPELLALEWNSGEITSMTSLCWFCSVLQYWLPQSADELPW